MNGERTRFEISLTSIRENWERLNEAVRQGQVARKQLSELQNLGDSLLELAQGNHAEAEQRLAQCRDRLECYDQESEAVLSESAGRVRSLKARMARVTGGQGQPCDLGDVEDLRVALAEAELEDQNRLRTRLSGREWIARTAHTAGVAALQAGYFRLQLSLSLVPQLVDIVQAAERARIVLKDPEAAAFEEARRGPEGDRVLKLVRSAPEVQRPIPEARGPLGAELGAGTSAIRVPMNGSKPC